jgi:tetratricopeptide (TPR) repeat protein
MDHSQELAYLLRIVRQALQNEDFVSALEGLKRLVSIAESQQDWGAAARHLGNLALAQYRTGQLEAALSSFAQGQRYAQQDSDPITEAGLLGNMGNLLREAGRHQDAIHTLHEALTLSQQHNDQRGRGLWLTNLGLVYNDLGQPQQASVYHMEAVKIAMQLEDRPNLALRLGYLGNTLMQLGSFDQAIDCYSEAVDLYLTLDRKQEAALRLGILGNLYAQRARQTSDARAAAESYALALEHYRESALLAHELNDFQSQAELAKTMGRILYELGYRDEARRYWLAAANIFTQLNLPDKLRELEQLLRGL